MCGNVSKFPAGVYIILQDKVEMQFKRWMERYLFLHCFGFRLSDDTFPLHPSATKCFGKRRCVIGPNLPSVTSHCPDSPLPLGIKTEWKGKIKLSAGGGRDGRVEFKEQKEEYS